MFVVVQEVEGAVAAVFATTDREQAHRVLREAEEVDRKLVEAGEDPATLTLIDACDTQDEFLREVGAVGGVLKDKEAS